MQLRLQQREVLVLAGENPFLEYAFIHQYLQSLGHILEMLASLVLDPALGVASVVAGKSVAATSAGDGMEQVFALGQLAEAKIENAGPVAVDQHHAEQRKRAQKVGDRLEVEMAVHKKLGARQAGGQIIFAPDVLGGARKHSFAMGSVSAQFARQTLDAVHVGAGTILPAFAFQVAQGLARQVLDENRIFFVRLVARRGWLEIESKGAGLFILKFS